MTPGQAKALADFRSKHAIEPVEQSRDIIVCRHDGVRIVRIKGGTFRHDAGFIRLAKEEVA